MKYVGTFVVGFVIGFLGLQAGYDFITVMILNIVVQLTLVISDMAKADHDTGQHL